MNVKEFSNKINLPYDKVRFMIQNGMFSFIKAVKREGKNNYSYYFEPIETKKYLEMFQKEGE